MFVPAGLRLTEAARRCRALVRAFRDRSGARALSRSRRSRRAARRAARCAEVLLANNACTAYTNCMQYTIRGIPAAIDNALRARARADGKSLNQAAVAALAEGAGVAGGARLTAQPGPARARQALRSPPATCPRLISSRPGAHFGYEPEELDLAPVAVMSQLRRSSRVSPERAASWRVPSRSG